MSCIRIKSLLVFVVLKFNLFAYLDITKFGHEQYQDIIISGNVVQSATHNHKDCDSRYNIIKNVLDQYKRPFTMIDIGASQGYYSFRAASDYPESVFVMLEGNNKHYPLIGTQLLDLCKENNLNNLIFLNRSLAPKEVQHFSECEHFDIVIAFNIIHWFGNSWKDIANAILNLGDNIIIETPPQETTIKAADNQLRKNIENYLISKNAQILGQVKRHTSDALSTIYLVIRNKNYLERKTWLSNKLEGKTHKIESDFNRKTLYKRLAYPKDTCMSSNWIPGINLLTFKMYCGAYPTAPTLKKSLETLKEVYHNDWTINNMILQGYNIKFIDFDDPTHGPGGPGGGRRYTKINYDMHSKLLSLEDPLKVRYFFLHKLLKNCK